MFTAFNFGNPELFFVVLAGGLLAAMPVVVYLFLLEMKRLTSPAGGHGSVAEPRPEGRRRLGEAGRPGKEAA
jgi:hypothetical protein